MKVLAHWEKLVVVGIMAFLTVVLAVGYVISERQQYRMLHPAYSEQYSAGSAINQLVGAAIENYESVIDAESRNLDCTLQQCETSSKSIPGVPADRALFTEAERFLLGWWPGCRVCQHHSHLQCGTAARQDSGGHRRCDDYQMRLSRNQKSIHGCD